MRKPLLAATLAATFALSLVTHAWAVRIYGATGPGRGFSTDRVALIDLGIDIDGGAAVGDTFQINVKKEGPGTITFSGTCYALGEDEAWVSIDILLNGTAVGQSAGVNDQFCSPTTGDYDEFVMASMVVPYWFEPGNYDIQVQASLSDFASGFAITHTGLAIMLQKR